MGYNVSADVRGFRKPKLISGKRPDMMVRKGNKEKVIEVETPSSHNRDKNQRKIFRKYTNESKNRSFRTIISRNKKGNFYFGVGSLFLLLVVLFVVIVLVSPNLGEKISNALSLLFGSVKG